MAWPCTCQDPIGRQDFLLGVSHLPSTYCPSEYYVPIEVIACKISDRKLLCHEGNEVSVSPRTQYHTHHCQPHHFYHINRSHKNQKRELRKTNTLQQPAQQKRAQLLCNPFINRNPTNRTLKPCVLPAPEEDEEP